MRALRARQRATSSRRSREDRRSRRREARGSRCPMPGVTPSRALGAHRLEASAHGVAHDGGADLAAHDEAEARRGARHRRIRRRSRCALPAQRRPRRTTALYSAPRVSRFGLASTARGQAESSVRPLARRAERMPRPARVRMRARKPCFLARRRLLGWKVRLLMGSLPDLGVTGTLRPETLRTRGLPRGHKSTD